MRKIRLFVVPAVFLALGLISGCSSSKSGTAAPVREATGSIATGERVTAATAEITPAGGAVSVTDPNSPLAGLTIDVPAGSYGAATAVNVSYSPIENHTFGKMFNPLTPVITVDNGGGYSAEVMEVRIPVKVPPGQFAMAFLYDDSTKQLEGLPLIAQDENSITVASRHFSSVVVSSVDEALLNGDVESGFRPGVDDWQFTNRGSYIAPEGHCSGQSMAAMWYYIARPDGKDKTLFGRYDNNGDQPATPKFWMDDSLGYRFSSVVQLEEDWGNQARRLTMKLSKDAAKTRNMFAYTIKLTGQPQMVEVWDTKQGGGHAMIAYRVSADSLFISDPNYPGDATRRIEYVNGKFKPYNSGQNADAIAKGQGKAYDQVVFVGKTALVDWNKMYQRWDEVKKKAIGNDYFPSYEIQWVDDEGNYNKLEDNHLTTEKVLRLSLKTPLADQASFYVYRDLKVYPPDARTPEGPGYNLKPGNNLLGILVVGITQDEGNHYIDFKNFNVNYKAVGLELTYPAGKSPKVFTEGWVFGAKCLINPGESNERDISNTVEWSGTGTFEPAKGPVSRPVFGRPGANKITLSVTIDAQKFDKTFSVNAVSPALENGSPLYAGVGDYAHCATGTQGCEACPQATIGPITAGSPNVTVRGVPAARMGDAGIAVACCDDQTFKISEGDPNVLIDGKPAARIGDKTEYCGGAGRIVGPVKRYYVLFQLTMPKLRQEKIPVRREGESDVEWTRRKQAVYSAMTYNDFVLTDLPLAQSPVIVGIADEATTAYPAQDFKYRSPWAMKISAQGAATPEQAAMRFDGSLLLTTVGVYATLDELSSFNPAFQNQGLKPIDFTQGNGLAALQEQTSSGTLGPLTQGWTEQDKHAAFEFVKKFSMLFDCFIAHAVYADSGGEKIEAFREFRDKVLEKSAEGSHLVRLYYEYGPYYAIRLKQHPRLIPAARFCLDMAAAGLRKLDMSDPRVVRAARPLVRLFDMVASCFFKEGQGGVISRCGMALTTLSPAYE